MTEPPADINLHARRWLEAAGIPLPDPWEPKDIPTLIEQFYPGGRAGFMRFALPRPGRRKADVPGRLDIRRAQTAARNKRFRERHPDKVRAGERRYYQKNKRRISFQKNDYYEKHKPAILKQKHEYYERKRRESA